MPTINRTKLCSKHGFYNGIENKQCPQCAKENNKSYDNNIRAKDRAKVYNSKRWKQVREKALLRDGMICQICKQEVATIVHHILELKDRFDLAYELDNLESVCAACHGKHHHSK